MNVGRIFANAIARRIAYVVVAAALAWMGLNEARAQSFANCLTTQYSTVQFCADRGTATQGVYMAAEGYMTAFSGRRIDGAPYVYIANAITQSGVVYSQLSLNVVNVSNGALQIRASRYFPRDMPCPSGQIWNSLANICQTSCSSRTPEVFTHSQRIPAGSHGCKNGCQFAVAGNGDGTYTRTFGSDSNICNVLPDCLAGEYLNVATSLCTSPEPQCSSQQTKNPVTGECESKCPSGMHEDGDGLCVVDNDDCPVGQVRAPSGQCLPGDGQCAVGEARRADGTCGRDSNGDGVADEDDEDPENDPEKEFFSGGDNCASPPSCSGGPIECGTARIQWRIDCNTRRTVNVTGGACNAMPVCVGENCKAMEYAQLIQEWRSACALEKIADREAGEGGDNQDLIDLLTDPGSIQPDLGGTGDMPGGGSYAWGDDDQEFEPDTSGMGWGSSCPSPPAISVFGQSISFNLTPLCNWLALAGNLVLILASLASLRIVSGGTA